LLGYHWDDVSKRAAAARLRRGGELQVLSRIPITGNEQAVKATPDGNGVSFLSPIAGRMEVWMTTWDQTRPVRLTESGTDRVFAYAWSPDGQQLVVSRGRSEDDVVLLQRK
jgi:Tol biopolymer transport system component